MTAQASPTWHNRGNTNYWTRALSNLSGFNSSPLRAGLTGGALGLGLGLLAKPLVGYLYPEMDDSKIPLMMGALGAGGMGYLSHKMQAPKAQVTPNPFAQKRAYYKNQDDSDDNFSSNLKVQPNLVDPVTHYMEWTKQVGPATALAMREASRRTAQYGDRSPAGFGRTVNSALTAAGAYLNPVNRVGWAMAGVGASLLGRSDVSKQIRTYGPAYSMLSAGLNMAGGR